MVVGQDLSWSREVMSSLVKTLRRHRVPLGRGAATG